MFLSPLSEFVFTRTYARYLENEKRRETWPEVVDRVLGFLQTERPGLPEKMWKAAREGMLSFDVFPSMRLLWSAGPAAKANNLAIYNCSHMAMDNRSCFGELLYVLMHGVGAGMNLENVDNLPVVPIKSVTKAVKSHAVSDSKEGWKDSVDALIDAVFGGYEMDFDYSQVRKKGAKLKVFGGRASGPEPLAQLHRFIVETAHKAQGRKFTTAEVHDIGCTVAEVVLCGGVRRSSLISLAGLNDATHRDLKKGAFPMRRYMANNSAIYDEKPDMITFAKEWVSLAESGSGERGIFNRYAARKNAPKRRNPKNIKGFNPCSEILLNNSGLCNLTSVVVRPDDDLESLVGKVETAAWLGTIQASFTDFPNMRPEWAENAKEEALLGVSLAGQQDHPALLDQTALSLLKKTVIRVNKKAAKVLGVNQAAATTCVKPDGTLGLLAYSGSGLHVWWDRWFIRRVRITATDPLCKLLLATPGMAMVPEVGQTADNCTTWVVEFPCKAPDTAKVKKDSNVEEQLNWYLHVQKNWCEHNASATIYVKPDEWLKVGAFIYEHFDEITGVSFLPDDGGVYELAPLESITEEEYIRRAAAFPGIDYSRLPDFEKEDATEGAKTLACVGDRCVL